MDPGDTRPSVSIIVVNWNAGPLLRDCVASIARYGFKAGCVNELLIVDNGSSDGSVDALEDHVHEGRVRVLRNGENRGFAAACNQGAAQADGTFLLFLNPDCQLLPGSVEACRNALDENSCIGAAGVALIGDDGTIARSCHGFPTLRDLMWRLSGLSSISRRFPDGSMRDWEHDADRTVDHVIGAFYMVRATEFRAIQGFDERFFVYLEDLDLSRRYADRGKRCRFLTAAPAYHKGGGTSEQARASRLFYATRSRILYAFKHFPRWQALLHLGATCLVEPIARLVGLLARGRVREVGELVVGFRMLYRNVPATLRVAFRK